MERIADDLEARSDVNLTVLKNPQQQGFVASVNRGMSDSNRDVLLLNSDTIVTARWLEKLQAAAYSSAEIATATPFSNNATICSLPRFLAENAVPAGFTVDSFAKLVEERSLRAYPRLPTGVGVCLYIKRRILARVGLFDERRFGAGYGEEVEFCLRCSQAGFVHVLDDATFIFHAGQRSFGAGRSPRVRAAHRRIRRRYPSYLATIARFILEDPLGPLRERINDRLRPHRKSPPRPPERILHLVHGWPPYNHAGTELYAHWLAERQADRREVAVYSRIADPDRAAGDALELLDRGGIRVRLAVNNFDQRNPLARNALWNRTLDRDFERFLDETQPSLVHIHHLAGHAQSLVRVLLRRKLPIVFQIQDWWLLCARTNLFDAAGRVCSGPAAFKCARCLPATRLPPARLWSALLYSLRARLSRAIVRRADALIVGSQFIADSLDRLSLLPPERTLEVIPYGVDVGDRQRLQSAPRRTPRLPLRFGCVGSMMPHKGIHVAVEAFRAIAPEEATLDLWGNPQADARYAGELRRVAPASVRFNTPFSDELKVEILSGLDALIVPSLGYESFGLAAREAMACGVPVIASRGSALVEIAGANRSGALFEPGDDRALSVLIRGLIDRPETLADWSRSLPPIKGMNEHAEEIEEVYARVLARRAAA